MLTTDKKNRRLSKPYIRKKKINLKYILLTSAERRPIIFFLSFFFFLFFFFYNYCLFVLINQKVKSVS